MTSARDERELRIDDRIAIPLAEIEFRFVRARGAGGQNVNKVATAIHLRFDSAASSLSDAVKQRLRDLGDQRVTSAGVVVIKAQRHRSQEKNRAEALDRLAALLRRATHAPIPRRATRPSRSARMRRVDRKTRRGRLKALRAKVTE